MTTEHNSNNNSQKKGCCCNIPIGNDHLIVEFELLIMIDVFRL